jgi:hypothetical protein
MNGSLRPTPALSSARLALAQSATFAGDAPQWSPILALVSQSISARAESVNGSGRSTIPFTTANIADVAPTASAIVATTANVNDGVLASVRIA